MANQIKYQVGFDVQKQGLEQVKKSLRQIQQMTAKDFMKINGGNITQATIQLGRVKEQAQKVEQALRASFNTKLNTVNIQQFHAKLKQLNGQGIQKTYQEFAKLGAAGENAFRKLTSSSLTATKQLRQSHNILDKMATTLANTVKWQIASSAINGVTRSIEQAWGYSKALDTSLNNIQIVTGKSADEMRRFAEQANSAAKQLGKTTTDYTDAALIFAQQGLNDEQIAQRADLTLKTANVTGQSAEAVSEQLTAVWNGYKVSAEEAELYVDRLAAIAATTASDLGELSTGMSKVAAAAAEMGVGEDQLAAQLSTIISVTKQAPESVGTALRTVYARISDIQAGIEQDGTTLGNYSGKMAELGINVLDTNGKLRDMGGVIEQIGAKWGDMTREQQINLAQTMAGQRQYSNLMALFQNFDKYNEAMQTAAGAAGTLQQQQDIYMESTAAHLNQLKASVEDIQDSLFNMDSMDTLIDGLSSVASLFANFIDSIGGGGKMLQSFGAIAVSVFSNQIARGIATTINNFEQAQLSAQSFKDALANNMQMQNLDGISEFVRKLYESEQIVLRLQRGLSPEEFTGLMGLINQLGEAGTQVQKSQQEFQKLADIVNEIFGTPNTNLGQKIFKNNNIQEAVAEGEKLKLVIQEQQNKFAELQQASAKALGAMGQKTDDVSTKTQKYFQILETLRGNGYFEEQAQQIDKLSKEFEEANGDIEKMTSVMERLNEITNKYYKNTPGSRSEKVSKVLQELESGELKAHQKKFADQGEKAGRQFINGVNRGLRTQKIEDIAKIISGLGQLSMGIQHIQNLGSIWKNADLSTGEKLLQTITNLSFSLPMLAKGFTDVGTRLGFLTVSSKNTISNSTQEIEALVKKQNAEASTESAAATDIESAAKEKNTQANMAEAAAEKASTQAKKENTAASAQNAAAQEVENKADEESALAKTAEATSETLSTGSKEANAKATEELAAAKQGQNIVTGQSIPIQAADTTGKVAGTAATNAFGFAVEDATVKLTLFNTTLSLSPWGIALITIGAFIAAIGAVSNALEKARQEAIENDREIIQQQQNIQAEIESHKELYKSVDSLIEQNNNHAISKYELKSSIKELVDQYGEENQSVQKLIGSYNDLAQALRQLQYQDAKKRSQAAQDELDAATDLAEKETEGSKKGKNYSAYGGDKQYALGFSVNTDAQKQNSELNQALIDAGASFNGQKFQFLTSDKLEDKVAQYKAIKNIVEEFNNTLDSTEKKSNKTFLGMQEYLKDNREWAEQYEKALKKVEQTGANKTLAEAIKDKKVNIDDIQNIQQYSEQYQKMKDLMDGDSDAVDSYLMVHANGLYQKFGQLGKVIDESGLKFQQLGDKGGKQLEGILNSLDKDQLAAALEIDPKDIHSWEDLLFILKQYEGVDLSNVKQGLGTDEAKSQKAKDDYATYTDLRDKVYDGKNISTKEYESLGEDLQKMFSYAGNGVYEFSGKIADFTTQINNLRFDGFLSHIQDLKKQQDSLKAIKQGDFDYNKLTQSAASFTAPQGVGGLGLDKGSQLAQGMQQEHVDRQLQYAQALGVTNEELGFNLELMKKHNAQGSLTETQMGKIAQGIQKVGDKTHDLKEKQKELDEASKQAWDDFMQTLDPLDADINPQQYAKLTNQIMNSSQAFGDFVEGFEDLPQAKEVAEDMAEGFLRWDDAIEDANKNFQKWQKNAKNLGKYTNELKDTYEDMLNLDGEILSDQFAEDADNLQLMQQALDGNLDAYNELVDRAQEDLWKNFLDIEQGTDAFENIKSDYQNMKSELEKNPIKLGDTIDFNTDTAHQAMADYFEDIGNAAYKNAIAAGKSSGQALTSAMQAEVAAGKQVGYVPQFNNQIIENKDTEEAPEWTTVVTPHDVPLSLPTLTTTSASGTTGTVTTVIPAAPHTEHGEANSVTQTPNSANTTTSKNTSGTGVKLRPVAATNIGGGAPKINNAKKTFNNGGGGSGKKGGGCFAAQTLITIPNNKYKFIEDIQIGDIVLSYNVEKRVNEYSKVVETMIHDLEESIYTIYIEDDILVSTGIHPFYIVREQSYEWVEASDLKVGDLVLFANGTIHEISNIEVNYQSIRVYNFEVSGNHNYYVGINQILVHNKGKGGKGKSAKKDTSKATAIKKETKKTDPYFRVNRQLSNQERILKDLEKSTERAFGKNKLDLLEQQEKALKRQNELLKKKQELNKKEIESLNKRYAASKKLAKTNADDDVAAAIGLTKKEKKKTKNKSKKKQGSKLKKEKFATSQGYGFTYDSDGEITNYTQLQNEYYAQMEKRRKQYSEAKKKYDKMTKKEQKDKYKKNVLEVLKYNYELWKDRLDKMRDAADKYVEELDLNKEITEKLQESFAAEIQLRIQKFAVAVEVDLNLREATRKWNDFVRNVINKQDLLKQNPFKDISLDMQRALDDYTTYLDKNGINGTGDLKSLIDQVNKSNAELKRTLSGDTTGTYGNDITKGTQDLKKWYDQLLDAMQQTVDLQEEIQQGYLDIHENAIEMLDEAIEKREYINELLEHEIDLYQLTYGINPDTDYYNTMNGYYEALYSNQLQQIDRLRANTVLLEKEWQQQLKDGNTELAKQYEQAYKSSLSSLNSLLIKSIETLKEKYSNAIDGIFNELDRHLSSNASGLGGSSLSYMNMEWQLMNQNAELYLDNVEAMYSMQSLQNKFQKAIDDDKNVKNQQALKKVMDEQLDILKQKGKITKYDVERAEKLLQIEKARIALEQAQSNKTSMRLKRDAQGNYSYQFVADTSQVEDAQQALLDLQNQLYTFDKQAYQDNLNTALNAYKDYQSRVKDILLDTALTQEEKDQQIALVKEKFETYITDLAKENKAIRINLAQDTVTALTSTYTDNVTAFSKMTSQQKDLIDQLRTGGREAIQGLSDDQYEILFSATGMVENWNTGIQRMMNKINSTDGGFEQVCLDAWGKISTATTDYKDQVAKVAKAAGQDLGSITSSTWALNSSILDTLDSQKNLTQAFSDQIGTANSLLGKLEELRKAYEQLATAAKNAAQAAGQTITNASNKIKNGNPTTGGSTSGSGGSTTPKKTVTDKQAKEALEYILNHLKWSDKQGDSWGKLNKSLWTKNRKLYLPQAAEKQAYKKLGSPSGSYSNEKLLDVLKKTGIWKILTSMSTTKNGVSALLQGPGDVHGYAQGTKKIPKDMIAWTQEQGQEAIYDKSRKAMLTPLGKGDKVFTAEMTDALWNVAEAIVNSKQTTQPNNPSWDMLKDQSKRRSINQAQADTAKGMAAAVELLRDISQELPTSLFDKAFNLNNGYLKDLIANVSKDVFNNINDTQQTQQTVTITASFPAVNSKKEIEEAFENLINMAAQRTMRNNNNNRRRRGL